MEERHTQHTLLLLPQTYALLGVGVRVTRLAVLPDVVATMHNCHVLCYVRVTVEGVVMCCNAQTADCIMSLCIILHVSTLRHYIYERCSNMC
jgi:hypothetical protein